MTQGGHEMMVSRGRGMVGRPEDGDVFEHGYLRLCQLLVNVKIPLEIPLRAHQWGFGGLRAKELLWSHPSAAV
jgi:hypothetical protein